MSDIAFFLKWLGITIVNIFIDAISLLLDFRVLSSIVVGLTVAYFGINWLFDYIHPERKKVVKTPARLKEEKKLRAQNKDKAYKKKMLKEGKYKF